MIEKSADHMTEFFMPMIPPTTTFQAKKVNWEKRVIYESPKLRAVRNKLLAHLAKHKIDEPYTGGVRLVTKWLFPISGNHKDGDYRITKPDTDNLQKLLKDCMTVVGFWKDDCLVASEVIEILSGYSRNLYLHSTGGGALTIEEKRTDRPAVHARREGAEVGGGVWRYQRDRLSRHQK